MWFAFEAETSLYFRLRYMWCERLVQAQGQLPPDFDQYGRSSFFSY